MVEECVKAYHAKEERKYARIFEFSSADHEEELWE